MNDRNEAQARIVSFDPGALADSLRSLGYDVEAPRLGEPPGSSITARRDLGDRGILVSVDGAGRFRIEITWLVGEWASHQEIAGIPARVVDSVTRAVNIAGQIDDRGHLVDVLAGLDGLVPWAGTAGDTDPATFEPSPEP